MGETSELLRKNKVFLYAITHFNRKQRNYLLKNASRPQILSIVEIILNILNFNLEIPQSVYEQMKKYKYVFRKLIEKQSWQKRKALLLKVAGAIVKVFKVVINQIYKKFTENEI